MAAKFKFSTLRRRQAFLADPVEGRQKSDRLFVVKKWQTNLIF